MSWEHLADWWLEEVRDPAYEEMVTPLLLELLVEVGTGGIVADLGSGDGRIIPVVAESLDAQVVGVELVEELAVHAKGPVVVSKLPVVPVRTGSLFGAYAVLVLDHLEDHEAFFEETARVVRPGGFLAVVSNHPMWTSPGSTPILDSDGEILWRPGHYFERGLSVEPADGGEVLFFHRSFSDLLNAAAAAGWRLMKTIEKRSHLADMDPGIPRLLGLAWLRDLHEDPVVSDAK